LKTETNLLIQSMIVNTDLYLLGTQLQSNPDRSFLYTARTDDRGWTGTLTGSIAGRPLNVSYTGLLAGDPDVSFDSDGTVGTDIWKGGGQGHVALGQEDPTTRKVGVTINPFKQEVGIGVTVPIGVVNWSTSATKSFSEHVLTIQTGVGIGEVAGVLPALLELNAGFDLNQLLLNYESFVEGRALIFFRSRSVVDSGTFQDPATSLPIETEMTITPIEPIPEPGTILLLATSLAGMGVAGWRQRKLN
jgi:hypothetical protein